jgi:hypothetical protein
MRRSVTTSERAIEKNRVPAPSRALRAGRFENERALTRTPAPAGPSTTTQHRGGTRNGRADGVTLSISGPVRRRDVLFAMFRGSYTPQRTARISRNRAAPASDVTPEPTAADTRTTWREREFRYAWLAWCFASRRRGRGSFFDGERIRGTGARGASMPSAHAGRRARAVCRGFGALESWKTKLSRVS